ncbi:MAG TPA: T9SS type A sorting domain-containing protein [Flavobacteriaceae bacterium]|nr:T9SS type A sorting domain-containing protein [Flavobacteriaceae bacterium]
MKTILYFLMGIVLYFNISNFLNAQEVDNPQEEFLENIWYLSKIEIDGTVYPFESNEETEYTTLTPEQIEGQTSFYLDYCAGAGGGFTFTSDSSFIIDEFVINLVECEDSENNSYKVMYFDVFEDNVNQEFEYLIAEESDHKSLVISAQDDSDIYYQNVSNMSVEEQQKSNLTFYPNPAKDFLYIENLINPVQIEIYDLSGKVLLNKEVDEATKQVNVSQLAEGVYLYQLSQDGQELKTGKLVKK